MPTVGLLRDNLRNVSFLDDSCTQSRGYDNQPRETLVGLYCTASKSDKGIL